MGGCIGEVSRRVGGRRNGVWGIRLPFRHGYVDQEVSTKLMTLCKRPHADPPIGFRPKATLMRPEQSRQPNPADAIPLCPGEATLNPTRNQLTKN
jgi:hypothetical protein